MHQLKRLAKLAPSFLQTYLPSEPWRVLSYVNRDIHYVPLRGALDQQQHGRCAYCECFLYGSGHIDHFIQQNLRPDLRYDWSNMVLSCTNRNRCGYYKDTAAGRVHANPLNPYDEDGRKYIFFISLGENSCEARIRTGLTPLEEQRAQETIEAYQLNSPKLLIRRAKVCRRYLTVLDELGAQLKASTSSLVKESILKQLEKQKRKAKRGEFCSACEDVLSFNATPATK